MRFHALIGIIITVLLTSCSVKLPDSTVQDSSPRIKEGFYEASSPEAKNVPLVSIKIAEGRTYAYSYLAYVCDGQTTASFDQSGITFSDNPTSAGGPGATVVGRNCEIHSDIVGNSNDSIQVTVTLNGVKQPAYILTRTSADSFVDSLNRLAKRADHFSVPIDVCNKNFGTSCDRVRLAAK